MAESSFTAYFFVVEAFALLGGITFSLRRRRKLMSDETRSSPSDETAYRRFTIIMVFGMLFILGYTGYNYLKSDSLEFYTLTELPFINSTQPVYLAFHWKTQDALIAGNPVLVLVEVINMPHQNSYEWDKIEIRFDGVGYQIGSFDKPIKKLTISDRIIFEPDDWQAESFTSDIISITYASGGQWGIWYCDGKKFCNEIPNVIEVSPHEANLQLKGIKITNFLTGALLVFTLLIILIMVRAQVLPRRNNP